MKKPNPNNYPLNTGPRKYTEDLEEYIAHLEQLMTEQELREAELRKRLRVKLAKMGELYIELSADFKSLKGEVIKLMPGDVRPTKNIVDK